MLIYGLLDFFMRGSGVGRLKTSLLSSPDGCWLLLLLLLTSPLCLVR